MFFQSTDSASFQVYVNKLSFRVPKVLYDLWNGTSFLFGKDLFPDKLEDFNGLVLRATSFNFPPYTYQARYIQDSHWSSSYIAGLSLVERFIVLLPQLSYAIKNQLGHPKPPNASLA